MCVYLCAIDLAYSGVHDAIGVSSIEVFIMTSRRDTFRAGVLSSDDKARGTVGESARGSGAAGRAHVHRSRHRCLGHDRTSTRLSWILLRERLSPLSLA